MDIRSTILDLNRKVEGQYKLDEMLYLKESWIGPSVQVCEMWSNPQFSYREIFQSYAYYWGDAVGREEYSTHQNIYEEMKRFSLTDKAVIVQFMSRWWNMGFVKGFFALYYIEFPFWTNHPPQFEFDSVEDFFKVLSEKAQTRSIL